MLIEIKISSVIIPILVWKYFLDSFPRHGQRARQSQLVPRTVPSPANRTVAKVFEVIIESGGEGDAIVASKDGFVVQRVGVYGEDIETVLVGDDFVGELVDVAGSEDPAD